MRDNDLMRARRAFGQSGGMIDFAFEARSALTAGEDNFCTARLRVYKNGAYTTLAADYKVYCGRIPTFHASIGDKLIARFYPDSNRFEVIQVQCGG